MAHSVTYELNLKAIKCSFEVIARYQIKRTEGVLGTESQISKTERGYQGEEI